MAMNLHNSVIDNASAETTIPDRILQTALTPWRQGNFVEVADQFSDVTLDYSPRQQERPGIRLPRIAIVGTGFVGSTTAYALLLSGMAAEVVLIGRDPRRAEGHVHDLRDAEVFSHRTRVFAGDFDDCCSADVTILTVGVSQSGAKSRLDGLRATAAILRGLVRDVARHNPRGILLIASNPVDVMTYGAWRWSGLPASQIIGSGTSLDTARFRRRLAERYGVASDNVHAYIIGEHGDSQFPVLSSAHIAGTPIERFCQQLGLQYDENELERIAHETRTAGARIISAKGATYYGIGTALVRIVRAILRDEHTVFTVSSLVPESLHLGSVSLSLPTIISRGGIDRVLPIPLNASEERALENSAATLKQYIGLLDD
jgi:L-lactate dehydrogenase